MVVIIIIIIIIIITTTIIAITHYYCYCTSRINNLPTMRVYLASVPHIQTVVR